MTGARGALRILGGAALAVAAAVATNQILSDKGFSWTWLYASFGIGVLMVLYTEVWAVPGRADAVGNTVRGRSWVYLRQLRESVRDMETVGVATQGEFVLRMRQVYVDVSLATQVLHATAGEPHLGTVSDGEGAGLGQRRSLESVLRAAERDEAARVLAVIGGPGSGKTTLARKTALALCEHHWRLKGRRLPVLLYLRDHTPALLADEAPGLGTVAVSAGWLEGKISARWLERRLDRGGCVVLLDGLDEVADPAERGRVVAWVVRQTQRHPRNVYVVTSRPHGYQSNPLAGAEVLQVRRFTGEQIKRFLHQWSHAIESRARSGTGHLVQAAAARNAEDLLARLRARPALYDLAANPLLLTMIANVHRYRGQLPGSRAELYAEMCEVLLHRRYEARGLQDATGLSGPHKQHVIQRLALAMMKAKVRDWPIRDAINAIRQPLRQVPGNVDPGVYLEEARKSGLLVEREHSVYGFAHLTLQEYLAAAQLGTPRANTSVLTGNVNDPWWRETIQLWAAGNDATDVITACLDSHTVHALALAFDCADQARTVDPAVRSRLEALLTSPALGQPIDPAVQRLLAGVLATRTLRETIELNETTVLCVRPIPLALYEMFIQEEQANGHHHPDRVYTGGSATAVGMQAGDAERFLAWLNIISDAAYRLPTPGEIDEHTAAVETHLSRYTVWAHDGTRTHLHQPPTVPWPYNPLPARSSRTPASDRQHITAYLQLLAAPAEQRTRIAHRANIFTAAFTRAPEYRSDPQRASLNVILDVVLDLALALALDLALIEAVNRSGFRSRDHNRILRCARALADALDRDSYHDRSDTDALDSIDRALALDPALDLERLPASTRQRTLADALNRALSHAVNHAAVLTHPRSLLTYNLADALTRTRTFTSVNGSNRILDDASSADHTLASLLSETLDEALRAASRFAAALDTDRSFVPTLGLSSDSVSHSVALSPTEELALTVDLTVDLARNAATEVPAVEVATSRTLFATLEASLRPETSSVFDSLDDLLMDTAARPPSPSSEQRPPEGPAAAIRAAHDLLDEAVHSGAAEPLLNQTRSLVNRTLSLLTVMRDRRLPSSTQTLACARTALLAAIAALHEADPHAHDKAARLLHLTWQSLVAYEHPSSRQGTPSQTLLLVRTQQ